MELIIRDNKSCLVCTEEFKHKEYNIDDFINRINNYKEFVDTTAHELIYELTAYKNTADYDSNLYTKMCLDLILTIQHKNYLDYILDRLSCLESGTDYTIDESFNVVLDEPFEVSLLTTALTQEEN